MLECDFKYSLGNWKCTSKALRSGQILSSNEDSQIMFFRQKFVTSRVSILMHGFGEFPVIRFFFAIPHHLTH